MVAALPQQSVRAPVRARGCCCGGGGGGGSCLLLLLLLLLLFSRGQPGMAENGRASPSPVPPRFTVHRPLAWAAIHDHLAETRNDDCHAPPPPPSSPPSPKDWPGPCCPTPETDRAAVALRLLRSRAPSRHFRTTCTTAWSHHSPAQDPARMPMICPGTRSAADLSALRPRRSDEAAPVALGVHAAPTAARSIRIGLAGGMVRRAARRTSITNRRRVSTFRPARLRAPD